MQEGEVISLEVSTEPDHPFARSLPPSQAMNCRANSFDFRYTLHTLLQGAEARKRQGEGHRGDCFGERAGHHQARNRHNTVILPNLTVSLLLGPSNIFFYFTIWLEDFIQASWMLYKVA
jgi:hypothetical protein